MFDTSSLTPYISPGEDTILRASHRRDFVYEGFAETDGTRSHLSELTPFPDVINSENILALLQQAKQEVDNYPQATRPTVINPLSQRTVIALDTPATIVLPDSLSLKSDDPSSTTDEYNTSNKGDFSFTTDEGKVSDQMQPPQGVARVFLDVKYENPTLVSIRPTEYLSFTTHSSHYESESKKTDSNFTNSEYSHSATSQNSSVIGEDECELISRELDRTTSFSLTQPIHPPIHASHIDRLQQFINPEIMSERQLKSYLSFAISQLKEITQQTPKQNFMKWATPVKKTKSSKCFSIYVSLVEGVANLYLNLGKILGKGTYKKVFKAVNISNPQFVALAKTKLENNETVAHVEAIGMWFFPHHTSILQAYFITETKTTQYILMPYCECGTLGKYQKDYTAFTEEEIKQIAIDILMAVDHIHSKDFVHRDIKPANILLYRDEKGKLRAKLSDFGFLTNVKKDDTSKYRGTQGFIPQELHKKSVNHSELKKGDDYAVGQTLYETFISKTKTRLFEEETFDQQMKVYAALEKPKNSLEKAIFGLCHPDPTHRLCVAGALALLSQN